MPRIAIVGGSGALGRSIVSRFTQASWTVTNIDFNSNDDATRNIQLNSTVDWIERVQQVTTEADTSYDSIIHAAGGWAGGKFGQNETLQAMDDMWKMNIQSSILACHLAARVLDINGLAILTGAHAALQPTPDMAAYGMSKAATHHMVQTLAKTLPSSTCVASLLPITIDTEMNRKFMATADHSSWTKPDEFAQKCLEWAQGTVQLMG